MNCYGPIPEMWREKIRELLDEIDRVQGFLAPECIVCASLLAAESEKRMEDMRWITNLKRRLRDLEFELKKSGGSWIQKALTQTQDLIWEIGGN
jgi:hypothetical protein